MEDFSEPTYILVFCWMPKPLPPRDECTGCFAPTPMEGLLLLDPFSMGKIGGVQLKEEGHHA